MIEVFKNPFNKMYALSDKDGKGVDIFDSTNKFVKNVQVENGILNISNIHLTSIEIPEGIKLVNCHNNQLTSLIVPQGVIKISCSYNNLTSLTLPEGIKSIYCSCNELTSLTLPEGIEHLDCSYNQLTSLTLPEGIKKVYCYINQLTSLTLPEGIEHLDCSYNRLTYLTLPEGIEHLDCSNNQLTSLIVPEGIESLDCYNNNLIALKEPIVEQYIPSLSDLCIGTILRTNIKVVSKSIPTELCFLIDNVKYVECSRCNNKVTRTMAKKLIGPFSMVRSSSMIEQFSKVIESKKETLSYSVKRFICYTHCFQ